MKIRKVLIAAPMALTLTSCGGDDGAKLPPPKTNLSPQFTSATATTVTENSAGSFYTTTATDADGDAVNFSISGGADAAFFQLSGPELSFVASPNFDRFADSNQDNVYDVILSASDGRGGTVEQTINVTVENDREGVSVRRITAGLNDPVGITDFLGVSGYEGFLLVAERGGTIWSVNSNTGEKRVWRDLNLSPGREAIDIASYGRGGSVGKVVVLVRDSQGIYLVLPDYDPFFEIKIADGDPMGARATLAYTLNTELGGQGLLVVAIGDPGGERAQGISGYGNVYIVRDPSPSTTRDKLFEVGRGIQQPSRIFDFIHGVLIADVGHSFEQELSPLVSRDLANFGWPFFEGNVEVQAGAPATLVGPSFVYPFGTGDFSGTAIRGGLYYDATDPYEISPIDSLNDRVLFADTNGSIFTVGLDLDHPSYLDQASLENRTLDFVPDIGAIDSVVALTKNFSQVLYILDADGEVFRVDPS